MGRKTRKALIVVGVIALALLVLFAWTRGNPYRTAMRLKFWWEMRSYYAETITDLENQVAQRPGDPALRIQLATAFLGSMKAKRAFEAAKEAYRLEPESAEAWNELAGLFVDLQRRGGWSVDDEELRPYMIGCAARLLAAARREPGEDRAALEGSSRERVGFLVRAGECYLLAGDRATASAIFGEAIELVDGLGPNSGHVWQGLALALVRLRQQGGWPADDDEFRPYMIVCAGRLTGAARRDPGEEGAVPEGDAVDRVLFLIVAGQCYASAGDRKTASALFDEALDLADRLAADPEEPTAQKAAVYAGAIRYQREGWLEGD